MGTLIDFTKAKAFEEWHANWISLDDKGIYKAYEPDNWCIYSGESLDDAIDALNNSTFGDE